MGQTLTNGIYLPDEGERNSYSGLEANWRTLDALILTVNGKAAPNVANTWTAAQTFTAGITGDLTGNVTGNVTGDLTGTAAKAIADEDGTSIKTGYVNVAGNQTVGGQKTWTATQTIKGASPALTLQSTIIQRGVAPAANANINLYGKDLNDNYLCRIIYRASPTGERRLWLGVNDDYSNGAISPTGSSIWNSLNLYLRADGRAETTFSADVLPETNNKYNLGTSTNKWKTLNGINPGALSLPLSANSSAVNMDVTNVPLDGTATNITGYASVLPGWVFFWIENVNAGDYIQIRTTTYVRSPGAIFQAVLVSGGYYVINACFPIVSEDFYINMYITSTSPNMRYARIYPCQGNV